MNCEREKYLLIENIRKVPKLLDILIENDVIIAGGCLTSLFSSKKINDFDLYFNDEKKIKNVHDFFKSKMHNSINTERAESYKYTRKKDKINLKFQLIMIPDTYKGHENIFEKFDFTICMAAYYFKEDKFVFHDDFFKHLSQRRLVFNHKTKYPINSLIRVKKYLNREFKISGVELLKMGLAINNLNMKNYQDLKEQMEGIDTLFLKDLTDALMNDKEKKYDFEQAMELIENYLQKYYDREDC